MKISSVCALLFLSVACTASHRQSSDVIKAAETPARISKSTSSFEFRTSVQKVSSAQNIIYRVEIHVYELAPLETVELRVFVVGPATLVSESPTTKIANVWRKTVQVEAPTDEVRMILEARGMIEGTPVGDSRPLLLHETSSYATTKAPSKAAPGFFPEGTRF